MSLDLTWRILGAYRYICRLFGNNGNAGNNTAPYQDIRQPSTFDNGTTGQRTVRVRSGVYQEPASIQPTATNNQYIFIADGFVVVEGSLVNPLYDLDQTKRQGAWFTGFYFLNCTGIDYRTFATDTILRSFQFNQCTLKGCSTIDARGGVSEYNLFINSTVDRLGSANAAASNFNTYPVRYHTLINSTVQYWQYHATTKNTFVDKDSNFDVKGVTTPIKVEECCFESVGGMHAQIRSTAINTIILDTAGVAITALTENTKFTDTATVGGVVVQFTNCKWTSDPMFNDRANEDFSLSSQSSPLFNEGNIIGRYGVELKKDFDDPHFLPGNGATLTQITNTAGVISITAGSVGTIKGTPNPVYRIKLPYKMNLISAIRAIKSGFNFTSGKEVADREVYNGGTNPDDVKYTYRFMAYDEDEPYGENSDANWLPIGSRGAGNPVTDADDEWYEFEWDTIPQLTAAGTGNGEPGADLTALTNPIVESLRLEITIRDNAV